MKKTILTLNLILISLLSFQLSFGQTTLTGTVTDADNGKPLAGAGVYLLGAKGGGYTKTDGTFSISAPSSATDLKVTYAGFKDKIVPISGKRNFTIQMKSNGSLSEVLIIAYGTQKKSDKTGAVTQVTAAELNKGRITDPIQGLQGKAAGVNVSKQGGDPNAGFSVNIRGSASLTGGSGPLYVVDGVVGIDPTTINPDDIESFNVLKDAASTSLYGTQGSNGVIIITTKNSGASSNPNPVMKLEYSSFVSLDKVANRLDFLTGDEIRQYAADVNSQNYIDNGANTDWLDEIYRTGISQQHTLAFSKSDKNSSYRASLSTNNLQGVLKGTSKDRYIARLNLTQMALDDKLMINARMSGTFEHNNYVQYDDGSSPTNVIYQAMRRSPTDPVFNADGSYFESDRSFQYFNPVAIIEQFQNERDAKRLLGNIALTYEIIPGLKANVNAAYAQDDEELFYFEPRASYANQTDGKASRSYNNKTYRYITETISYEKTFKDVNNLNVIGGHSWQAEQTDGFSANAESAFSDYVQSNNLGAFNEVEYGYISSYMSPVTGLASFFSRAIYDYDKKYYLTASLRRDKSTKYGADREWGTFWAVSSAWNLKKEKFLLNYKNISDLKLRVGYGVTGNADIPDGIDRIVYKPDGTAINPETGQTVIVFNNTEGNINNPDLGWEEVREINLGLDFGIYKNKITGSLEYYRKTTSDLVMEVAVEVPPNPAPKKYENSGEIQNNGFEASINAFVLTTKNLKWKTTGVFSRNIQNTVSLGNLETNSQGIKKLYVSGRGLVGGDNYTQVILPGHEIGSFFLPVFAGLSQDGKFLYETEAGGVTRDPTLAQRQFVGSAQPDFIVGWSNYFEIGNGFDASMSFRGIFGHQIFNVTKMVFSNPADAPTLNVLSNAVEERENGLTSDPAISTYYLEDGDFVKLDNLSIGYNVPLKPESKVSNLRFYVNGNNVWMWTKYSGLDPELNFSGTEFGRDQYDVYPRTRSLTLGLNVSF